MSGLELHPGDCVIWLQSTSGCGSGFLGHLRHPAVVTKLGRILVQIVIEDQGGRTTWVSPKALYVTSRKGT